jgi:hypothetical protein
MKTAATHPATHWIGLFLLAALLLVGSCRPATEPPARFEFHPHISADGIAIWRCDRRTGRVDLGLALPNGTTRWVTFTNAPAPAAE